MAARQSTKPLSSRTVDRKSPSGKKIADARKPKGQSETRRTHYGDVSPKLGNWGIHARRLKESVICTGMRRSVGSGYRSGRIIWTRSLERVEAAPASIQ